MQRQVTNNMPESSQEELALLRAENAQLKRDLEDLELLYETTTEHGEAIEDELAEKNIALEKIQARLQEELDQALRYVMALLPEPMTKPVRAEWLFIPSSELGGDSFGYHWIDSEHLAVYLLDVCGHGVGAALLSVTAITTLRGETLSGIDFRCPSQVLTAMNTVFDISRQNEMFLTLWYGVYHRVSHQLTFAGGGHNPAILIAPSSTQTPVSTQTPGSTQTAEIIKFLRPQPIIGMVPDFEYQDQVMFITEGSRLFVFSDGVYELQKVAGGMFSLNELCNLIGRYGPQDHPDMHGLVTDLRAVQGRKAFDDDFSMIILDF
jgi:sigma-B regulation protein RsbU (phosphoserine phosphatase)